MQPFLANFDYIYCNFAVIFFKVTLTHWLTKKFLGNSREQFPRKCKCLNEWDTHKFVTAKCGRKNWEERERGKMIPSGMVVNELIPQEEEEPRPSRQCNDLAESLNCKIPWIRTDGEMWRLGSVQYTRWMCLFQVLYDKRDISADKFFYYYFLQYLHRIINITDRFSFNCPFGSFPTFIKSLLISIHWVKSFNFFSAYLLEIYQAQRKYSNFDVLLTAWLVSMKICPKRIFISVFPSFHLPVKIKVQKKKT